MTDWDRVLEFGFEYTVMFRTSQRLRLPSAGWLGGRRGAPVKILRGADSDQRVRICESGEDTDSELRNTVSVRSRR